MKFIYALGLVVSSYFLYKYKKKSQRLLLVHSNNRLSRLYHLINSKFFESFSPSLFLISGHAQTFLLELVAIVIRFLKKIFKIYKFKYEREIFDLSDGCKIAIDHAKKRNRKSRGEKDKILLIFPGVTSTSDDYYVKSLVEDFVDEYDCKVLNYRGFGGIRLYSPLMISTNCYKDVQEYIIKTCKENPLKKVFAVGFSFGGHLLSKALGDKPDIIPKNFFAGCGICYPTCLEQTKNYAEVHFRGLYSKATLVNLKKTFMENLDTIFSVSNEYLLVDKEKIIQDITNAQLCSDWDTVYTCRVLKFNDINEYYKTTNVENYLANIRVPYLSMFCEDDPIIPITSVPFKTLQANPNTVTVVTQYGGHLAFFGGLVLPQRIIDQPIKSFLKTVEILRDTKNEDLCFNCNLNKVI
jgi:predicted alpha/beta-fold hydrolase